MNKTRKRLFDIIQIGNTSDRPSRYFDIFIAVVIIANISVLFLETFQSLSEYFGLFDAIDDITVSIFIVEYILRIWTADFLFPEQKRGVAIFRFITSANGIIELLTILPFFFLSGMVVFRMLRVVRIFHLFRLNSHYDSFSVIRTVLNEKKNQILSSLFIIFIVIMASLKMRSPDSGGRYPRSLPSDMAISIRSRSWERSWVSSSHSSVCLPWHCPPVSFPPASWSSIRR